jgi:hypothetical protein
MERMLGPVAKPKSMGYHKVKYDLISNYGGGKGRGETMSDAPMSMSREPARFQMPIGNQPHMLWFGTIPRKQSPSTRHATLGVGRVWKQTFLINHNWASTLQKRAPS